MNKTIITDLLFIQNDYIGSVAEDLNRTALQFIPICIYLGVIGEYFSNWDFKSVGSRALQAMVCMLVLFPLVKPSVLESFKYSDSLIQERNHKNVFVQNYLRESKRVNMTVGKTWDWKIWEKVTNVKDTIFSNVLFGIGYLIFMLLKQIYSIVFYLNWTFFGFMCALSIPALTKNALIGLLKTWVWLLLMPMVVAIIIIIIGDGTYFFAGTNSSGIIGNAENMFQFIIFGLVLLLSPMITQVLISSSGIAEVGTRMGQMAAMSMALKSTKIVRERLSMGAARGGLHRAKSGVRSFMENRKLSRNLAPSMGLSGASGSSGNRMSGNEVKSGAIQGNDHGRGQGRGIIYQSPTGIGNPKVSGEEVKNKNIDGRRLIGRAGEEKDFKSRQNHGQNDQRSFASNANRVSDRNTNLNVNGKSSGNQKVSRPLAMRDSSGTISSMKKNTAKIETLNSASGLGRSTSAAVKRPIVSGYTRSAMGGGIHQPGLSSKVRNNTPSQMRTGGTSHLDLRSPVSNEAAVGDSRKELAAIRRAGQFKKSPIQRYSLRTMRENKIRIDGGSHVESP
jgi:hypothetical protein